MKNRKTIILFIMLFFMSLLGLQLLPSKMDTSPESVELDIAKAQEPIDRIETLIQKTMENRPPVKSEISIAATGDIMFHGTQIRGAYDDETGNYDFYSTFHPIKPYIENADIALANFETVTAGPEHRFTGYPRFNTPKTVLETLKRIGFDILSTANNHSLDRGKEGIIETIDNIHAYGMENIGTYKETNDSILIKEVKGIKIAFLSYTFGCNGLEVLLEPEELNRMVNLIDEEKIQSDIEKATSEKVDITAVSIHWGYEYHRNPSVEQQELGQKMMGWGADIILGSHPHVIQNSEMMNHQGENKFIMYSMGNFISNQRYETVDNRYTEDGIIVNVKIEKDFIDNETSIVTVDYTPTWVYRYKDGGKYQYEILPVEDYLKDGDSEIGVEVFSSLQKSYKDTMSKVDQKQ